MSQLKLCRECETEKPFSEFHKHKRRKDGLQSSCKKCQKAKHLMWQKNNRPKNTEYKRSRLACYSTEERMRHEARKNPRWGVCILCEREAEQHHEDYSKMGILLCRAHHCQLHHGYFSLI